jgi:hypothetical protein
MADDLPDHDLFLDPFHGFHHIEYHGFGLGFDAGGEILDFDIKKLCQLDQLDGIGGGLSLFPFAHGLSGDIQPSGKVSLRDIALLTEERNAFT